MDLVLRESFLKRKTLAKRYLVISPSLMKPELGDMLKFRFNPVFDLGFPEFTDHFYEPYTMSDLDILFDDDHAAEARATTI